MFTMVRYSVCFFNIMLVFGIILVLGIKLISATAPHIVLILADDLGWNDVSFHGSDQILTPNIDALACDGVILNSHYVQSVCTPSRSSLMTGRYPIHIGMQGNPIFAAERRGLPKGKILPEYLKDLNYVTRAIGKWHLGYYKDDLLPDNRGFCSFFGYYNGYNSYYDYLVEAPGLNDEIFSGFDLRRNTTPAYDVVGKYATDAFTDEAVDTILNHDKSRPLFLYVSHLAVHAGNDDKLLEAPQEVIDRYQHITHAGRRTYAAMVAKLDESVGRIVGALEKGDMLQNSIIIFLSDNGAPTIGIFSNWGSNYPLRGIKATLWEGGVRGAAFIWSPLINQNSRVTNELMHISDWLPTLYSAAGGNISDLPPNLDGVNQWETITKNVPSKRKEILLNIDEISKISAIRVDTDQHHWKLLQGTPRDGQYDNYYGEGTNRAPENNPRYSLKEITSSLSYKAMKKSSRKNSTGQPTPKESILLLRDQATVRCNYRVVNSNPCSPKGNKVCLYDLKNDPCEFNDLSLQYPSVVSYLLKKLNGYKQTLVPQPYSPLENDLANPAFFNNSWSPWYNEEGMPYVLLDKTIK